MPDERTISMRTAATFMPETLLEERLLRERRRRGLAHAPVLRVDLAADLRHGRPRALHRHHVTRDVRADASGGGVARERHAVGALRLDVAGPVGGVAEIRAAAHARH